MFIDALNNIEIATTILKLLYLFFFSFLIPEVMRRDALTDTRQLLNLPKNNLQDKLIGFAS